MIYKFNFDENKTFSLTVDNVKIGKERRKILLMVSFENNQRYCLLKMYDLIQEVSDHQEITKLIESNLN